MELRWKWTVMSITDIHFPGVIARDDREQCKNLAPTLHSLTFDIYFWKIAYFITHRMYNCLPNKPMSVRRKWRYIWLYSIISVQQFSLFEFMCQLDVNSTICFFFFISMSIERLPFLPTEIRRYSGKSHRWKPNEILRPITKSNKKSWWIIIITS